MNSTDATVFTLGPFAGVTFGDVRRDHPEFVFSLMNRTIADAVVYLDFVLYCIRKMRQN